MCVTPPRRDRRAQLLARELIRYRVRRLHLFRDTVVGTEAVGEGLAVLVGGVLLEHLASHGALERLEALLALDGEGGGILGGAISSCSEHLGETVRAPGNIQISAGS